MFFQTLFFISLGGIIFLFVIHRREQHENELLHSFYKSCNIDSVRFEKRLLFLTTFLKKQRKKVVTCLKKIQQKLITFQHHLLHFFKKKTRKLLFKKREEREVSDYISKIKK